MNKERAMQLNMFTTQVTYTHRIEPVIDSWNREPTGCLRVTVWCNVKDPCDAWERHWIERIYEDESTDVLLSMVQNEYPTSALETDNA